MNPAVQRPTNNLLIYLVSFIVGSGLGSLFNFSLPVYYLLFIAIGIIGINFLFTKNVIQTITICVFVAGLGFFWTNIHFRDLKLTQSFEYEGTVELLSISAPAPQQKVVLLLKEGERQNQKVRAFVYDWTYLTGTELKVSMDITPSQFSSDLGSGIIGLSREVVVNEIAKPPGWLWQIRHFIAHRIEQTLAEPYASLAIGLLMGAGNNFDPQFKEQLQVSGTSHLVAVSGYNMTIVALMISRIANRFGQKMSFLLSLGAILFYYLLTGMSPAVARGAIFTFFLLWAKFLGRPIQTIRILLLTAVLMIFFWPLGMIYSLSWQLSFLAFVGILFLEPVIRPWFSFLDRFRLNSVSQSLAETLAAQIPVLPLTVITFGTVSLISPLTNIAVLSLTPYAMLITAFQAVGSIIAIPIGNLVAWLSYPLLWLITFIIQTSSTIPFASVALMPESINWFMISYGLLLSLGIIIGLKRKKHEPTL